MVLATVAATSFVVVSNTGMVTTESNLPAAF
jgi:hypothetical protein